MAEERDRVLIDTILRITLSCREWDFNIIPTHVSIVMDNAVGQCGIPADPTVSGPQLAISSVRF